MPTKAPTTVDELGLRTHCPDGHRIYWPEKTREGRTGEWAGQPNRIKHATGGVCSDGASWDQQQTPTRKLRSWEMRGRDNYEVTGPPRLEYPKYSRLSGGHGTALFTVTFTVDGTRRATCAVQCERLNFIFKDERSEHPNVDTNSVKTDADWLDFVRKLRDEGWQMYPRVQCPGCQIEQAAYDAYMKRMTDAALALEQS